MTRAEDALVAPREVPPLTDDSDGASLQAALRESISWLDSQDSTREFVFGPRRVPVAVLRSSLEIFLQDLQDSPTAEELTRRVEASFDVLEAAGGADGTVLYTGYYEPVIEASLVKHKAYPVPLFGAPRDILSVDLSLFAPEYEGKRVLGRLEGNRVLPYWTREEIRRGALTGKVPVIAWAKDPVDVFFVEVQGSGTLALPDGKERRVGYAGSNGRPYRSVGSLLVAEGAMPLETTSMQSIRAWLAANPAERDRVLAHNESYVFFQFVNTATGALGRPVTPGRSIATDLKLFPHGALAFVETTRPVALPDGTIEWRPLRRFVLNQDTGGAIKGAGRVDFFWGKGPEAELSAGMMKQPGRLFFLVPKRAVVVTP